MSELACVDAAQREAFSEETYQVGLKAAILRDKLGNTTAVALIQDEIIRQLAKRKKAA